MNMRQNTLHAPKQLLQASAVFNFYMSKQQQVAEHCHKFNQLIYASKGCLKVNSSDCYWVIPPHRAVWIPSGITHTIIALQETTVTTLYTYVDKPKVLSQSQCIVVSITLLLQALLVTASNFEDRYHKNTAQSRIIHVLLDQLDLLETRPLMLPTLLEPRLKKIADYLNKHPDDIRNLASWGKVVGASARTLSRLFQKEIGMSYLRWRLQFKLLKSIEWLAEGKPIQWISDSLGYANSSAFIYMFHTQLGITPTAYFRR